MSKIQIVCANIIVITGLIVAVLFLTHNRRPVSKVDTFQIGQCVDYKHWVGKSRQLHGNTYRRIVEKSLTDNESYIVKRCSLRYKAQENKASAAYCILDSEDLSEFTRIDCPLK